VNVPFTRACVVENSPSRCRMPFGSSRAEFTSEGALRSRSAAERLEAIQREVLSEEAR
jgi:hypothetical protein